MKKHYSVKRLVFWLSIVSLFATVTVLNIMVSASYSTSGEEIKLAQQRAVELKQQNQELEQKILERTSLVQLQEKALAEGYSQPNLVVTITEPRTPIALSQ